LVPDPSLPHVVLIGLPGSGKSTVGPLLAAALGRPFLDFDVEIVRREGTSVAELFQQHGEDRFRDLEEALTREVRGAPAMVLAPGGGWVTRATTVSLLRPPAWLVFLSVSPEVALRRMGAAAGDRPLLNRPDPAGELARLLAARRAAYETADFVVSADLLDPEGVTQRILQQLRPGQSAMNRPARQGG
jgi:shikimate kinase